ncbi:MerR family transcriptional regulator [Pseudoalteromonas porphyrae]|uniref:MerR family transcriptional regulator n=2 Tax=Pseudoalteromonas TaxID=53246 RepID=A0A0N1MVC7_9GAMM|nr:MULTISPECIES: MerR family transcriptional regulator [Pseudoalteromonas]KPH63403.1 MerR family transcriptional regulator [Pseudoalteromonas porphyrae]KPH94732.1 MerR family transcriptional regulator [Pseudoalteromonas porphyrae]NMR26007.1 MerR family transcriptional regulator [Pseudoalteromonas sp. NEC-BIFX-2020_015]NNG45434.1 MerR family transcriptional regulator [Pseudoalteromonas sp. NEC-BIFX-2020_002]
MFIGKLSEKSGVSVKTIRFYEEIALIKRPQRSGKYRVYDDSYIEILTMIKLAKTYGFTLKELTALATEKAQHGLIPIDLLRNEIDKKREIHIKHIQEIELKLVGLTDLEARVARYNQCLLEDS